MTFAVTDFSIGNNRIAFAILDPQTGVVFPKSLEVSTYYLDSENPNDKIQTLDSLSQVCCLVTGSPQNLAQVRLIMGTQLKIRMGPKSKYLSWAKEPTL